MNEHKERQMADRIITQADIDNDGYFKENDLIVDGRITVALDGWLCVRGRIEAGKGIEASCGIEAGKGIKAGCGIEAGDGITAGKGIEAGCGIQAQLGIVAKTISSKLRIMAGLCYWRTPTNAECEIRAKLLGGTVFVGTLVEPKEEPAPVAKKITRAEADKLVGDMKNLAALAEKLAASIT